MSNTAATSLMESSEGFSPPTSNHKRWYRMRFLWSPVLAFFLLTVIARVWLTIHTHGVISGDEALVGIQAEHILHGELPIYFYNQPYLGSLQAYFLAGIFLLTGPSVWAMRVEPMLISLVLVALTWRFSAALAEVAQLPPRTKTLFMTIATLVAALPPLYDMIEEMRTKEYTEAITLMLWLLLCAFRLTQRWREGASARELALRWAGIGFLMGLGLWVDPIVVYAILTIALWIGGYVLFELVQPSRHTAPHPRVTLLQEALLVVVALPASLVGFAPGLYWGAQHQWANIHYLFQNGGSVSQDRLHSILQVQQLYSTCLAPRVLGGALPTQPGVTVANPHLLTFGLVVSVSCLALIAASLLLSVYWPHPLLLRIRQLTLLPLLFIVCASLIFCTASISVTVFHGGGCSSLDPVGRYVMPLVIALPFLLAALFTLPTMIAQERKTTLAQERAATQDVSPFSVSSTTTQLPLLAAIQAGLLAVLVIYFCVQGVAYIQANPRNTFQQYGCASENPTDLDPIITYMQQTHIRYAWANGWLGFPIMFKTNSAILVPWLYHRIPGIGNTVLHADRPSFFFLAQQHDLHPAILHALDANNVKYHIERFYSEPGIDALLVTPLNRTVSPLDPAFAALFTKVFYYNCI